ncbi:MAG: ABC transporter ATP-binding protein [Lachnospiraceae bacterium]|nr:ABC transporter ATP-binding protein [Lachnospiraceae bacterium]
MEMCVKVTGLECYYGKKKALSDINFSLEKGKCLGILGPNGAGKTTLIRNIMGVIPPKKGKVNTLGFDASENEEEICAFSGYLPEGASVYMNMTLYKYLTFFAELRCVDNADEAVMNIIKFMELEDEKDTKLKKFSKGMIQKAKIAAVIVHKPRLLILDEPTDGLDISATCVLVNFINGFVKDGLTVLICTHLPDIINRVCTDILFINKGKQLFFGTKQDFLSKGDGDVTSAYQVILERKV